MKQATILVLLLVLFSGFVSAVALESTNDEQATEVKISFFKKIFNSIFSGRDAPVVRIDDKPQEKPEEKPLCEALGTMCGVFNGTCCSGYCSRLLSSVTDPLERQKIADCESIQRRYGAGSQEQLLQLREKGCFDIIGVCKEENARLCSSDSACDDRNPCTTDTCSPSQGCIYADSCPRNDPPLLVPDYARGTQGVLQLPTASPDTREDEVPADSTEEETCTVTYNEGLTQGRNEILSLGEYGKFLPIDYKVHETCHEACGDMTCMATYVPDREDAISCSAYEPESGAVCYCVET